MIGYAFCGSFCTLSASIKAMRELIASGYDIMPIMSDAVYNTDTRFGKAAEIRDEIENLCGKNIIHTIVDAEPIGPKGMLDALVIAPCTGNTLAKIALGITDTPVCMAAKAQLRSDKPVVIALSSNDALSANLKNISLLIDRRHVSFVPMTKDDPEKKPHSLVAKYELLAESVEKAIGDN
jgi:dipicolinate synthase subunit B